MVRKFIHRAGNWTGFRGKTLWDWMSLLMVPLVIGGLAAWFQVTTNNAAQDREDERADLQREMATELEILQQQREDKRAEAQRELEERLNQRQLDSLERISQIQSESEDQRAQVQLEIEADRARQDVLQSYVRDMTALLLDQNLATSQRDDLVRQIARSNTLSTVRQLDSSRKALLLRFLYESNLIGGQNEESETTYTLVLMRDADLSGANLSFADLSRADLRGTDLHQADLSITNLHQADLSGSNLIEADLSDADLSRARLTDADLSRAGLRRARNLTNQQLAHAASLLGASLPDGTVNETEEQEAAFKERYGR